MKSCEENIAVGSEYFVYSPSIGAREAFFYPLYTGHFIYLPGYSISRTSYDSFLLLYINSGELNLTFEGYTQTAVSGQFMLIDCYQPHTYYTNTGCDCIWCHFDGICARPYYQNIVSHLGNVFSLNNHYPILHKLNSIYETFLFGKSIREPLMSKYITDILTAFLLYTPVDNKNTGYTDMAEAAMSYISEHFKEDISVAALAEQAGFSQFHFIRIFKKETGFTPHEYIINTRLSTARYLLKNSKLSIKDICYNTGFSCESVFCNSFKKHLGITPAAYRTQEAEE